MKPLDDDEYLFDKRSNAELAEVIASYAPTGRNALEMLAWAVEEDPRIMAAVHDLLWAFRNITGVPKVVPESDRPGGGRHEIHA